MWRLLLTVMHVTRTVLSYIIMLSVMSFNVYIFCSAVIGLGLGYFIFSHGIVEKCFKLPSSRDSSDSGNRVVAHMSSAVEDSEGSVREIL
jgi:hypothetical protein